MTTLTARSPEDLLAVVPVVLGFEPADSIVMLTLDARQTFHARVDLPARSPRRRRGGRPAARAGRAPPRPVRRAAALHRRRRPRPGGGAAVPAGRAGRAGPGAGRGAAGRRRALVPAAGRARWPGHDRGALRRLQPPVRRRGGVVGPRAPRLPDRPRRHAPSRPRRGRPRSRPLRDVEPASGDWVAARLAEWVGRDGQPPTDVAARLLVSLAAPPVRDVAWASVSRTTARDHVRFWEALVRRAPGGPRAPTPPRCWRCAPGWRATVRSPGARSTARVRPTRATRWPGWWPASWSPPSPRPTGR